MTSNPRDEPDVLSTQLATAGRSRGGPHGLGDPNDTSLRKVEQEVCIPGIIRERAHREKCHDFTEGFGKCGEKYGFWAVFKCRDEVHRMNQCLTKWFHNEEFKEECTQMYLAERKQYRETGILKKAIKRPYYINPEKELERINKIKKEYQRLEEKDQS